MTGRADCAEGIAGCSSREEAVRRFLDLLDQHGERIEATQRKIESIYRFTTPDAPFFSFDVEGGHQYRPSRWVSRRSERSLDIAIQSIAGKLERLPKTDVVPILGTRAGGIDFLPRLFGGEFETSSRGECLPLFHLVHDLARDVDRLPEIDVAGSGAVAEVLEDTAALIDYTEGRVCVTYPYMQGCLNNVWRFMDQEQMLLACVREQDQLRRLIGKIYQVRGQVLGAVRERVGNDDLLRVRGQGHHPPWVRGLVIDDFISVVRPEDYYDTCADEWEQMSADGGAVYLHTCGPIAQCIDLFGRLPGLLASEFVYAEGQQKTTRQVEELKAALAGKVVLYSMGLPSGGVVDDPENLTPEWVRRVSLNGAMMLHAAGTAEQARELCDRLEL